MGSPQLWTRALATVINGAVWLDDDGRGALFDAALLYRYALWRTWDATRPWVAFVGLNPSTADALNDDPTIRRCCAFAERFGGGALVMVNLFAWRATEPTAMKAAVDPVGAHNDTVLGELARAVEAKQCALAIAAWGAHGHHRQRQRAVAARFAGSGVALHCLGCNRDGTPKHPLYLRSDTNLQTWEGNE